MSPSRATPLWRVMWTAIAIALTALDLRNEDVDTKVGRTHVTGTTFSCFCRWLVANIPGGRILFTGGLLWFCTWFHGHILNHVDAQKAERQLLLKALRAIKRNTHR